MLKQIVNQEISWKSDKIADTKETIQKFIFGWNWRTYVNKTENIDWESSKEGHTPGVVQGFKNGY